MGQPQGIDYDEIDKAAPEANAFAAPTIPDSQPASPTPAQEQPGAVPALSEYEADKPAA